MNKTIKISVVVLFFTLLAFLAYKIYAKIDKKQQIAENIRQIPAFYFYTLQDSVFTNADLQQGKATLIINFHPDCEHCQYEAEIIGKRLNDFANYQLVWVSYADTQQIKTFAQTYRLSGYKNITFLHDKNMVFSDIFGKSGVPTSFIYDKNGKLRKQFKGEVKVEALLKYLSH